MAAAGAIGGGGATVLLQVPGQTAQLILDNHGHAGANTPVQTAGATDLIVRNGATGSASSSVSFADLYLEANGWLIPFVNNEFPADSLTFSFSGNASVQAGGGIVADFAGYAAAQGPGQGRSYSFGSTNVDSGGGHGGYGGGSLANLASGGTIYDNTMDPSDPGSGGGSGNGSPGGVGGGIIRLAVNGTLELDGIISANGGSGSGLGGGGGSGGSIWLSVGTFSGVGSLAANGGSGAGGLGGGGGGGMIYVSCANNSYAGALAAYGGGGANWGGAGATMIQVTGHNAQLILDAGGHTGPATTLPNSSTTDLILRNGAVGLAGNNTTLGSLLISSNAQLFMSNSYSYTTLTLSSATIQAGGSIIANATGSAGGVGTGEGHYDGISPNYPCSGAGHGGIGGNSAGSLAVGGNAFGSPLTPEYVGSGGGTYSPYSLGGAGGGGIRLTVTGLLENDGVISANGGNGTGLGGGGGSGGSIYITAGTFSGAGSMTANGGSGAGSIGGGGGGGCIAVYPTVNQFTGTISAYGGGGANWGGAGIIYIQTNQFIIDNDGQYGAATPLNSLGGAPSAVLVVRNGAVGLVNYSMTMGGLVISSNAQLFISNSYSYTTLTLSSATIQAGGGIIANAMGSAGGMGNGEGHYDGISPNYPCSGAGHGGYGANSAGNLALSGATYDSISQPEFFGSGGGNYSPYSLGGAGGGAFRLSVTGLLQNDGVISANGGNGSGLGGGGGAGGSIWITAGTLAGSGSITANGGSGAGSVGGGGGGGRIAIYPTADQLTGAISAYGGGGAYVGGAGTIYVQTNSQTSQLILDNDGQYGVSTPISSIGTTGLIVRNGAEGVTSASLSLVNVLICSNSLLFVSNISSELTLTMSSATVEAGGGIIADSGGAAAGQGSGLGRSYGISPNYPCSGAGHGGNGGNSAGNSAVGGVAYDQQTGPGIVGSGGGTYSTYSLGGAGGGAMRLTVTGLLQNDGVISANGGNGTGTGGGGGSGGSIWLTAGTLAGAGSIAANGGSGAGSVGGGGAGGCIYLYPTANLFAGTISAYGGGGANWGAAGTVYIQAMGQTSQFILDNDGQFGAATPIQPSSAAVIVRNGAAGYQQSLSPTFASLLVNSNGWLIASPISGNGLVSLTVSGNATVEPGGGIVTDAAGYAAQSGAGLGRAYAGGPYYPCSGAGYGGDGAASMGNLAAGGPAYGSVTSPASNGSGGGNDSPYSFGGAGGGTIRLTVNGTLQADGKISANGGGGSGLGGGGGAAGSIWLTVGTLTGSGSITANGGSGVQNVGGGGGGGRISIGYAVNDFIGAASACGGGGFAQGGAGTIYTKANSQPVGQLLLDNGGTAGTNTPVSAALGAPSQPFNLTIQNGAIVSPQTGALLLSNLTVASGGRLTASSSQTLLDVLVFGNADVALGGAIAVDGQGYSQAGGPGAGLSSQEEGSGAGYGGAGGASSTAPGGASYGSSNQPSSFGSGGGLGNGPSAGGSQGGGALRLNVGGVLTVDGEITANGEPGLQDNSGGGSGGSIWVTAGALAGGGQFAADGGAGDLYGGGGGAGGRIALYSYADVFFGLAAASGAGGESTGSGGTLYLNSVPPLQVLSNSPSGIVNNVVTFVTLFFNGAPNPNTVGAGVLLTTPNGPLASGSYAISMLSSTSYQVSFPLQTAVGNYSLAISTNITDLYGQPLSAAYTGTFAISLPVIEGSITDTNGDPLAGVLLQASGGLSSTITDTNGNYALGFLPGMSFTVTPSLGALIFIPPSLSYTNISATVTNQNYLAVSNLAPILGGGASSTNFILSWQGMAGVSYQVYSSPDLINWQPYGSAFVGSNALVQIQVPTSGNTAQYFSVQSGN
jgi:hypothetical protein